MADVLAAGKALVDQFVAKLPEDLRGPAAELFGKPEAQDALKVAGESALMRSDYSRNMDAVAQEKARVEKWHADLAAWHAQVKDVVTLGEAAKKSGWSPDTPDPAFQSPAAKPAELPADLVRAEQLEAQAKLAVDYVEASADLRFRHFQNFGEILNVKELIADPRVNQLGIQGVYDAKYRDRLEEKAKAARDADWSKREAEIRADERRKVASRPLTPVGEGSPLDALDPTLTKKPGSASVDDMAAAYEAAVAAHAR